jgi:hypothetical protein
MLKENSELRTSFYLVFFSIIFLFLIFLTSKYENLTYNTIEKPNNNYLVAYNVEFVKWLNYDKINYYVKTKSIYTPSFEYYFALENANLIFYEKNKNIKGSISNALIYKNLAFGKGSNIVITYNYSTLYAPYFKIKYKNIFLYDCYINNTIKSKNNNFFIKSTIPLIIIYLK